MLGPAAQPVEHHMWGFGARALSLGRSDPGRFRGSNLPEKTNAQKYSGIDTVTEKSNFCIFEWMLERCMEWLSRHKGYIVMLCKVAVVGKFSRRCRNPKTPAWKAVWCRLARGSILGWLLRHVFLQSNLTSWGAKKFASSFRTLTQRIPVRFLNSTGASLLRTVPRFTSTGMCWKLTPITPGAPEQNTIAPR